MIFNIPAQPTRGGKSIDSPAAVNRRAPIASADYCHIIYRSYKLCKQFNL